MENRLLTLYGWLLGRYLPQPEGAAPPTHPVALQVFDELSTLHTRLRLIEGICKWLLPQEDASLFSKLAKEIRNRAKERNKIVHGLWGVCEKYQEALVLIPVFGKSLLYRISDFEQLNV